MYFPFCFIQKILSSVQVNFFLYPPFHYSSLCSKLNKTYYLVNETFYKLEYKTSC